MLLELQVKNLALIEQARIEVLENPDPRGAA